jgi:hypothetical protein
MTDPSATWPAARRALDDAPFFCGPNLRVRVAVLNPGIVLVSAQGEVVCAEDVTVEATVFAELERELERNGTLTLFADLRQSPRFPAASREMTAQWMLRHQRRLRPSHVLVQSKIIEMAMSVVTMLVGSGVFEIHTRPQPFWDLLKKVAPKLTELPGISGYGAEPLRFPKGA